MPNGTALSFLPDIVTNILLYREEQKSRVLIIINDIFLVDEDVIKTFQEISQQPLALDIYFDCVLEDGHKKLFQNVGYSTVETIDLPRYQKVFIPTIPVGDIAAAAQGLANNKLTSAIQEALLRDIEIIVADDLVNPDRRAFKGKYPHAGINYCEFLRQNLRDLTKYGVVFAAISESSALFKGGWSFPNTANLKNNAPKDEKNKGVIGGKQVSKMPANTVLEIPANSIITALAKDTAKEKNIEIKRV